MNILQRICHRLFGWDYVAYRWGFGETKVRRVGYMPNGRPFIIVWGIVHFLDDQKVIWEPLTWFPSEAKP